MSEFDFTQLSYLVVDDEDFVLNLSVRILGKLGCEKVETANNGNVALEKIDSAAEPFDIAICDLNMPEMDGVEFMRHAAGKDFSGGVIFLSGEDERMLDTARDLAEAHNLNIIGAMPKPLKPDALKALLEQYKPKEEKRSYAAQESITEEELRAGINDGTGLLLVYQPKVNIKTGEITGVETLARWQHPERGMLGPGAFIPLSEESGLIDELTYAIYRGAVSQVGEWLSMGIQLRTSINVAVNTFTKDGFVDFVTEVALEQGVDPSNLVLEVTESQVMEDAVNCLEIMMRLRMKKFGLSIDDFGTGHSSMAQLKQIPFTELKVDRAFVYGAVHDSSARAILESSVSLAKNMKMEIVAEGAENREDWDLVESLECDYVQGFYCAKPMSNDQLMEFMEKWTGPH
jgi:EAL domain-containing protein (putative c-di-GMP-specific phosphodiesterase class I)